MYYLTNRQRLIHLREKCRSAPAHELPTVIHQYLEEFRGTLTLKALEDYKVTLITTSGTMYPLYEKMGCMHTDSMQYVTIIHLIHYFLTHCGEHVIKEKEVIINAVLTVQKEYYTNMLNMTLHIHVSEMCARRNDFRQILDIHCFAGGEIGVLFKADFAVYPIWEHRATTLH